MKQNKQLKSEPYCSEPSTAVHQTQGGTAFSESTHKAAKRKIPISHDICPTAATVRLIGILAAAAMPYSGIAPFGLSFMSSEKRFGVPSLISFAAVSMGYLTLTNTALAIKYICCAAAYLLFLFVTDNRKEALPSAVTIGAVSSISLLGGITEAVICGFTVGGAIKILCDAAAAALGGVVFNRTSLILRQGRQGIFSMDSEEKLYLGTMGCIIVLGLAKLKIGNIFCLQTSFSFFSTLMLGLSGGIGCGAVCGTVCGILGGASSDPLYLASTLAICGTAAGLAGRTNRYGSVTAAAVVTAVTALYIGNKGFYPFGYMDIPLGITAAILVPEAFIRNLRRISGTISSDSDLRCRDYIRERLEITSDAFRNLAGTLFSISDKTPEPDIEDAAMLFDGLADRVCRNCSALGDCWVQNYDNTCKGLFKMLEAMENKGTLSEADAEKSMNRRCLKIRSLVREANSLHEIYKINSIWKSKLCENRELTAQQLANVARILDGISGEIYEEHIDSDAEEEIRIRLSSKGFSVTDLDVTVDTKKRYFAYIGAITGEEADSFRRCAETALRMVLGVKMIMVGAVRKDCDNIVMRFAQPEGYIVETAVSSGCASPSDIKINRTESLKTSDCAAAAQNTESDEPNGDKCIMRYLSDGKFAAALSDGMGTGARASRDSSATVRLLGDFLEAGFDKKIAVRLINSIMVMKSAEEAFATVDMCVIDLFCGTCEFIKNGAEPCYIKRGHSVETVRSASLPIGVVRDVEVETFAHRLNHGDIIVMMSDGILVNSGFSSCKTFTDTSASNPICGEYYNIYDSSNNNGNHSNSSNSNNTDDKNQWIRSVIEEADPNMPPGELADRIMEISKAMHGGICGDDMTVCVIKLLRRM